MGPYLIVFEYDINAKEFIDKIDVNDIIDHFSLDNKKITVDDIPYIIPYELTPYAVILDFMNENYYSLIKLYDGIIVEDFIVDNY